MKTYYSIIKISPNSMAGDLVSIGLLVCQENEFWIRFSDRKKTILKKLIENSDTIDFVCKQLEAHIKRLKETAEKNKNELFLLDMLLQSEYFEYLNRYSNGLLQFSTPAFLNDDFSDEKFDKLFSLLIDSRVFEEKEKTPPAVDIEKIIEQKLIERVENKIHTRVQFSEDVLQSVYFKFQMDCIGLNGAFVGAKSISFSQSSQTIDKNIAHYSYLISVLSTTYQKEIRDNNFYLIADEPEKKTSEEHKIWRDIKESPLFKVIPVEAAETVAEMVEKKEARKFLEMLD